MGFIITILVSWTLDLRFRAYGIFQASDKHWLRFRKQRVVHVLFLKCHFSSNQKGSNQSLRYYFFYEVMLHYMVLFSFHNNSLIQHFIDDKNAKKWHIHVSEYYIYTTMWTVANERRKIPDLWHFSIEASVHREEYAFSFESSKKTPPPHKLWLKNAEIGDG